MLSRYYIGTVGISAVNLPIAVAFTVDCIRSGHLGYICVANTRTSYLSNKDPEYCLTQNNSLITVPDGSPLVWIAQMRGLTTVGKCSGKNFMEAVFHISEKNAFSHFFYGCSNNTLELMHKKLMEQFPELYIKDAVSPPFQPLEKFDIESLAEEINNHKPTFFWCGLGAPKQERLMALLQPKLDATVCVGVGLAFEYFAGTVNRVSGPLEKMGFEWLSRCFQQPIKARRFITPFFWMIVQLLRTKAGKI